MLKRLFIIIIFLPFFFKAQTYPSKPTDYVTDEAGILNAEQLQALNNKLGRFEKTTSTQIFVYISNSLQGQDMSQLCQDIFHNWKIGGEAKDNGLLVAIFISDHQFRIHTGYGLEGVLPDLLTKRIQDADMKPYFKDGDYYNGLDKGLDQLMAYSQSEFKPVVQKYKKPMPWIVYAFIINAVLLIGLILALKFRSKRPKRNRQILLAWGVALSFFPVMGALILLAFIIEAFNVSVAKLADNFKSDDSLSGNDRSSSSDSSSGWFFGGGSSFSSGGDYGGSSDTGSGFDGGGGGDSGGGGSSDSW